MKSALVQRGPLSAVSERTTVSLDSQLDLLCDAKGSLASFTISFSSSRLTVLGLLKNLRIFQN